MNTFTFFFNIAIYLPKHFLSLSSLSSSGLPDHPSLLKSTCLVDSHPWALLSS